ncbi:MAG TPA: hypothetical protein VGI97_00540 [Gemmatimonadaceae bacterium]
MGETCEICGLELASVETRNLLHAGELVRYGEYRGKCIKDVSCIQRGYKRSQEALAAARRALDECADVIGTHLPGYEVLLDKIAALAAGAAGRKHWPDCALNHGGTACDMGPDCGTSGERDANGEWIPRAALAAPATGDSK